MLGFTPFKKRPNQFNYTPRYYDPRKEEWDNRRAELRGERAEDADKEYTPGQFIRTKREARIVRRAKEEQNGRMRIWKMMGAAVLVMLFIYILYPKLADVFIKARTSSAPVEAVSGENPQTNSGGLDQSGISDVEWQEQPITVVPNDYQE